MRNLFLLYGIIKLVFLPCFKCYNEVSFIVPVHNPKFNFARDFILSVLSHQIDADVIIVFASTMEKETFNRSFFGDMIDLEFVDKPGKHSFLNISY